MNDSLKDSKRLDPLAKSRTLQKNHDLSKKAKELLEKTFSQNNAFSLESIEEKKPIVIPTIASLSASATSIIELAKNAGASSNSVEKTPQQPPMTLSMSTPKSLGNTQPLSDSPGGKIDAFLKELFESRLQNMMALRVKMEEITSQQKVEEERYVQTVKDVLKQRGESMERETTLLQRLEEMESKMREQFEEKMKTEQLLSSFKNEGNNIILKLRSSFDQLNEKYAKEKEISASLRDKNAELQQTIKKMQQENILIKQEQQQYQNKLKNQAEAIQHYREEMEIEKKGREQAENLYDQRINQYKDLINEEAQIIDQLRMELSKRDNDVTSNPPTSKKAGFSSLNPNTMNNFNNTENEIPQKDDENLILNPDEEKLYSDVREFLDPEEEKELEFHSSSPAVKIKVQHRLIKILLARLKFEENERLKTEEQSAAMVAEEERTIQFLEKKIKELEVVVQKSRDEATQEREKLKQLISDTNEGIEGFSTPDRISMIEKQLDQLTSYSKDN